MTAAERRPPACQHELFEAQVLRSPAATAVVAQGASLTYAELDVRANRLASHLQALGVGPDVLVGVCLERSLELAISLLAILKAGGACVPLDPSYPPDRTRFMVDDAAVAAVLTSDALAARLQLGEVRTIRLDVDGGRWARLPAGPPARLSGPDDVAYVIYTSGSTGQPRGVLLTHRGLVNHHLAAVDLFQLDGDDRVLQLCSIGFDASIEEIFPTWAAGATVVFRPEDEPLLGRSWLGWLKDQRITVLNLPTAYWHEWTRDLERLGEAVPEDVRLVVVGGERAQAGARRTWLAVGGGRSRWVNAYGPTEATCMATAYEPAPGSCESDPPIGRPLPDVTVQVVDEEGAAVPDGVTGELLIGGAGLARAYLNRPDLTAERFLPSPDGLGARRYRTGDMVRRLPGGDLEFVGRLDDQVKVQGFRVECGEVEAALALHPAVAGAVVTAPAGPSGGRRLVAYVVPAGSAAIPAADVRRFLAGRLPEHMVPSAVVTLDAFPLTPHGKVDRDALPAPEPSGPGASPIGTAPRSEAEQRIASIWAEVLGIDVSILGVDDDFFERGGHSLLAAQVVAQVREAFDTELPLRAIFESPTVAGLAALVAARGRPHGAPPLVATPRGPGARFPLSLAQEQMWALEMAADPPGLYNVTAIHRFDRPVDEPALQAALAHMVERHESLRTSFVVDAADGPSQVVAPAAAVELVVSDLAAIAPDQREEEVRRRIAEQDALAFDVTRCPLLRAGLLHLGGGASRLVVTFDHLVCDGTSAEIFMTELAAAYDSFTASRAPQLPPLEVQPADHALWQRQALTEDVLEAQLAWWVDALEGLPPGPAVPFDRMPQARSRRIAAAAVAVPPDVYELLQHLARSTQSSVFVVAAAAVQAVLGLAGGTTDVVVSTTVSGRQRTELEGLVGTFGGVGRIRTDLSSDPTFTEIVRRARTSILGLFEHQDIPFRRVRQVVQPDFPTDGLEVAATLPIELGYFHTPGGRGSEPELFFRGQLHPLSVTLLDDGDRIRGELSYKQGFYDATTVDRLATFLAEVLEAVGRDPHLHLSDLSDLSDLPEATVHRPATRSAS